MLAGSASGAVVLVGADGGVGSAIAIEPDNTNPANVKVKNGRLNMGAFLHLLSVVAAHTPHVVTIRRPERQIEWKSALKTSPVSNDLPRCSQMIADWLGI
jgi:hypothetical protein